MTHSLIDTCLDAFRVLYNALNDLVAYLPMTFEEILLAIHEDLPLVSELLLIVSDIFGTSSLTLMEIIFGSILLIIVGSIAGWLVDLVG